MEIAIEADGKFDDVTTLSVVGGVVVDNDEEIDIAADDEMGSGFLNNGLFENSSIVIDVDDVDDDKLE